MNQEPATRNSEPRTPKDEPATPNPEPSSDMTATYIRVIITEVLIIIALWVLGRTFS
jgi:hypothetical protein